MDSDGLRPDLGPRTAIQFTLPWPSAKLSPNGAHGHWAARAQRKKRYRRACCVAVLLQGRHPIMLPPGAIDLEVEFVCPDRGRRDRDNLLARVKSGLDGLCDALGIDDSRFRRVTVSVADEIDHDGRVVVRMTPAAAPGSAPATPPADRRAVGASRLSEASRGASGEVEPTQSRDTPRAPYRGGGVSWVACQDATPAAAPARVSTANDGANQ